MAHLPVDDLPSEFDVVVEGTGLIESILAAALAKCGKTVLHLDRNGFYGELWASLSHKELMEWLESCLEQQDESSTRANDTELINVILASNRVSNFTEAVHGSEEVTSEHEHDGSVDTMEIQVDTGLSTPPSTTALWKTLGPLKRRLVYDVCPKVLACRGMMVDMLTKSGCSRYVEFKAVSRICLYQSGEVEQVPCSRADVFESKLVSMLEKRKLMKFLAFCSNFEEELDIEELEKITFIEYLRRKDLTENLVQYVMLCIAMTEGSAPALEGLQSAKSFLKSLGRFDNAPFLYPIFGGGELPQAFCRCCAVFGGVYCLKRSIDALTLSNAEDHTLCGITCSNGQKIACKAVVCNASTMKNTFGIKSNVRVSRAIVLVDGPLKNTEGKLTLLTIPPFSVGQGQHQVIRVLQLDSSTKTAVDGTYMVHFLCQSVAATAKQDLEAALRLFYNFQEDGDCDVAGPCVLWSLFFNLNICQVDQSSKNADLPSNLYLTSDPDLTMAYQNAVKEAQMIFERLCPNMEFLEVPLEPEES